MPYPTKSPYVSRRDPGRFTGYITDLISRGGDIEAQRAALTGQAWGQGIAQAGQALGQGLGQFFQIKNEEQAQKAEEQAQKAEIERRANQDAHLVAILRHAERTGNIPPPSAFIEALEDPERGLDVYKGWLAVQTPNEDLTPQEAFQNLHDTAKAFDSLSPELRAQVYPEIRQYVLGNPLLAQAQPDFLPEQYTPDTAPQIDETVQGFLSQEPPEFMTVGANERVLQKGPEGLQEVVSPVEKPTDPLEEEKKRLTNEKLRLDIEKLRADPEQPPPKLDDVRSLAKDWKTATQPVRDLNQQVDRMRSGMAAARRGDLGPASQAVLVTFQKVLDPPSVVRESEFERSGQALGIAQQFVGKWEKAIKGGAGVPLPELEKYSKLAEEIVQNQNSAYLDAEKKRLGRLASAYNIDPTLVFEDVNYGPETDVTFTVPNGAVRDLDETERGILDRLMRRR